MSNEQFFSYLLLMAGVTYLIRAIPFALITKKIENPFIKSVLYYIPYAVLSAMTLPAAIYATSHPASAIMGIGVAVFLAYKGKSLTLVAGVACTVVFLVETLLSGIVM